MNDERERLTRINMEDYGLPNGDQLIEYIVDRYPVGGFLEALITNNLRETFVRADDFNQPRVYDYVRFLYNHAPSNCWGSPDAYLSWTTQREEVEDEV